MANRSKPRKAVKGSDSGTDDPPGMALSNATKDREGRNVKYKPNFSEAIGKGWNSLVDRGANGGITGRDTRVMD